MSNWYLQDLEDGSARQAGPHDKSTLELPVPRVEKRRFTLVARGYAHPDALMLVDALFKEQIDRYGYADPAAAEPGDYLPPSGLFLVGYVSGEAVACGGYRRYDLASGTIEIKKMYTWPSHRGLGLGRAILHELQRHAAGAGAVAAILETGIRNGSALALYTSAGFQPSRSYVPGRDPRINRAFSKSLLGFPDYDASAQPGSDTAT